MQEQQLAVLESESEQYASDYQKLMELEGRREALNGELMALYEKWEELNS